MSYPIDLEPRPNKYLMALAFAVVTFLLATIAGCAPRPVLVKVAPYVAAVAKPPLPPLPSTTGNLAQSWWDCRQPQGTTYFRYDVIDMLQYPEIRRHEAEHRRQMTTMPCPVWNVAALDPEFVLRIEAQAMCAQALYTFEHYDVTLDGAFNRTAMWFSTSYDGAGNLFEAERRIRSFYKDGSCS